MTLAWPNLISNWKGYMNKINTLKLTCISSQTIHFISVRLHARLYYQFIDGPLLMEHILCSIYFFMNFRMLSRVSRISQSVRGKALLPELTYQYHELEPYISADIMELHHSKDWIVGYNLQLTYYKISMIFVRYKRFTL